MPPTNPITPAELSELDRLWDAATPGEWAGYRNHCYWELQSNGIQLGDFCSSKYIHEIWGEKTESDDIGEATAASNVHATAALHNAYPALRARIAELEERSKNEIAEFIDGNGTTCDCCQHVMIDVTSAQTGVKNHCVAGDSEGEGEGCAGGWHETVGRLEIVIDTHVARIEKLEKQIKQESE